MGAEDIGIGSLGIYSGCLSPKNTLQNLDREGGRHFYINFEKLASHGKSWQYFYNFYSKKWHDFS